MRARTTIAIFVGIMFVMLMGYTPKSDAQLRIGIGIDVPLPHVVLRTPPALVVIPGTYAYYAPDAGMEIFFYHGYWYRSNHGHWYRARGYNGPWRNIRHAGVPHAFRNLPPDFRRRVRHHERIRYADFHNNWRTWEKEKHWDRRINRHEVRGTRHGVKRESKYNRSQMRNARHGWKNGSKHDIREARNARHEGKKDISRDMGETQDARHGGQKDANYGKHGKKGRY